MRGRNSSDKWEVKALSLSLILILTASPGLAEEYTSIESLLSTIEGLNNNNTSGLGENCPSKKEVPQVPVIPKTESPRYQKVKDQVGEEIDISVISEDKAKALFARIKQEQLGLRNPAVCAQRAHLISWILEREGVISGKLFVKPGWFGSLVPNIPGNENGSMRWNYHVAPFIYVEKNGKIEQWVIDPYLFDKPVPRAQWEAVLSSHPKSSFGKTQTTRRFIYRPSHVHDSPTGYLSSELMETRDILSRANSMKFSH